jgi:hypothetical protein
MKVSPRRAVGIGWRLGDLAGWHADRPLAHQAAEHLEPRRLGERAERFEPALFLYFMDEMLEAANPRRSGALALPGALL